jgi:hypothetical protein
MTQKPQVTAIVAEFDGPGALLKAAKQVREAGYTQFDCHSPFPIHGMDDAMGLKRSPLGWIVGAMATVGVGGALFFQWWTSAVDYKFVISGKPFFSFQAYVPIIFGIGVLLSAFAAAFGMFHFNRLPRLHHPVFSSEYFKKFSTDGFFVSIEATDEKFDAAQTKAFCESIGATYTEVVEDR